MNISTYKLNEIIKQQRFTIEESREYHINIDRFIKRLKKIK